MSKTLWVVGGGQETLPALQRAKAMGLRVVVSDASPDAPGFALADHAVIVSTYNVGDTVQAALVYNRQHHIDGVIALSADVPLTVATVAKALGLPGLPIEVAALGADKLAMKRKLQSLGCLTTDGVEVTSLEHLRRLVYGGSIGISLPRPIVLKPMDSRGARGVIRLLDDVDPQWAYMSAVSQSPRGRVLAEGWVDGPQFSTETIIYSDGTCSTFILDRNYSRLDEFAPYVIEDGAQGPTIHEDLVEPIADAATKAAKALVGDTPCTVKGDLVASGWSLHDAPWPIFIVEMALRLSGGYMSSVLIPQMTGIDIVGIAIRLALGERVEWRPENFDTERGVAIRYDIPPGCKDHTERKGHAIATAATRQEAAAQAEFEIASMACHK